MICQLEGSGKWPDDLQAFRRLKAAFHIKLGEVLMDQQSLPVHIMPTHVDVRKVWILLESHTDFSKICYLDKKYKSVREHKCHVQ